MLQNHVFIREEIHYYIDSDVFLADIVGLADSWHFFLIFGFLSPTTTSGKFSRNVKLLSRKTQATQQNRRYSAKNNVAIL